jgi:branched-chain amino acid transport system substrate-binding protein
MIKKTLISIAIASAATLAQADVVVGVAGPHTGAYAAFGEQLWKGAEKAAADINAKGGINGEMIKLIKADDACEPKQAVSVANRLVDSDDAVAVVGHFCSSSSIPASRIYDEAGVLMVTPASTNPTLTEQGLPGVFRVCGRDDQQGDGAASYIINTLKAKRVAVIHDKDTYGKGLADATKSTLNSSGLKEVMYEGLTRGEKDFNALITKIRSVDADVVYFGGLHSEAGPLVRQLREQGSKAIFISGDGIVSDEFVSVAGSPKYVDGVLMTFGADPTSYPAGKTVVQGFRADGYEPEGYTLYSYTAMQIVAAALSANDLDPVAGAEWLKSHSVDTVMGEKSFDSKGDLTVSDYVMYEWDAKGKYSQVN